MPSSQVFQNLDSNNWSIVTRAHVPRQVYSLLPSDDGDAGRSVNKAAYDAYPEGQWFKIGLKVVKINRQRGEYSQVPPSAQQRVPCASLGCCSDTRPRARGARHERVNCRIAGKLSHCG